MPIFYAQSAKILPNLVGKQSQVGSFASNAYLALSSTEPAMDGTNITEPSAETGYERALIGMHSQTATQLFGTAANGEVANTQTIFFHESSGAWGDPLTHFVIFTDKTGGTPVCFGKLVDAEGQPKPVTVTAENTVVMFKVGELVVKIV